MVRRVGKCSNNSSQKDRRLPFDVAQDLQPIDVAQDFQHAQDKKAEASTVAEAMADRMAARKSKSFEKPTSPPHSLRVNPPRSWRVNVSRVVDSAN